MARLDSRRILACTALLTILAAPAAAIAEDPPLAVLVTSSSDIDVARVTIVFSRRVEYRLDESRSRLRLKLEERVAESSEIDQRLPGNILERVRFFSNRGRSDIVFHLGKGYETFASREMDEPFRVILEFYGTNGQPAGPDLATPPPAGVPPSPGSGGVPPILSEPPGPALEPEPVFEPPVERDRSDIRTIIIDPGHGGEEEGAVSASGLREKDLVLSIARRLQIMLEREGYKVALTREADQGIDLGARTAFANNHDGDLLLSIHANSSVRRGVSGAETYFLSYGATDEEASALARLENEADDRPSSPGEIELVLWEMAQAEHLARSSRVAELIQFELNGLAGVKDRGVKQAPFRVLVGADMPAALVEVGFLSNRADADRLATADYQDSVATALVTAIGRFRQEVRSHSVSTGAKPGAGQR